MSFTPQFTLGHDQVQNATHELHLIQWSMAVRLRGTSSKRVLGPYNDLLDKSFADNPKVLNNRFLVQSEMDFFGVDAWMWHPTRHVRYLFTYSTPITITKQSVNHNKFTSHTQGHGQRSQRPPC